LLGGDRRKIELAYALLLSLPGSPIVYYGDEIGMGDNIWLNDRDGVRTPMQWDASANAGFANADVPPERLYAPLITDERFGYHRVNVAAQRADPHSFWHTLRQMLALRKAHPAFSAGAVEFLDFENVAVLGIKRLHPTETILALHNLSAETQTVNVIGAWHEIISDRALSENTLRLSAYQSLLLIASTIP
jgi:maltose alpha-D-glucosyltransferase/alpha-amylase